MNAVGSTEAGQAFSLVCNVTLPTEATPRPAVTWIKVTDGSIAFPEPIQETTSTTVALAIPFSPLTFSHRGQYRCIVTLNISTVFNGSKDYNISVDSECKIFIFQCKIFIFQYSVVHAYLSNNAC